jgi:Xaa-Pro aminopeptidase
MRSLKQPIELQAIQKAIDITTETLSEVIKRTNFEKYRYENEIEADISGGFRRRGADGDAFTPIVASGKRACTIHYDANNAKLGKNELVIMDVGAQFNNYAADIARTVSVNKNPSERSQAVYNAVLEACEYAKSQLKPGVMMKEYELSVRQFIGKKLKELGLIKIINPKKLMRYYPHATSHFLGLEPHDAGDYSKPLQDGMVLAVEPGIYIAEESIGVRIENNVLITTSGVKVLSGSLPCTLS